jgi:hypothetical protein
MTKPGEDLRTLSLRARRLAPWFNRSSSSVAKEFRQRHLEIVLCEFYLENDREPGSVELAKQLGVTPRTVRTYLKERRERLWGPEKVWYHLHDKDGKEIGKPELLTIDECARRAGLTVREIRRQFWEQRRDWIAKVREEYRAKAKHPSP